MIHYLIIGLALGGASGLAPGPLLALVIAESLRYGISAGVKVALAPIITDLPIILFALFIVNKLTVYQSGLGIISLAGGLFLLISGIQGLRTREGVVPAAAEPRKPLLKGALANVLNPHPYLFWISVGTPLMSKAAVLGPEVLAAFIAGFYLALVGSKVVLAVAVGRSREFLGGRVYLYSIRALGGVLCLFAGMLFRDGALLLGLIAAAR